MHSDSSYERYYYLSIGNPPPSGTIVALQYDLPSLAITTAYCCFHVMEIVFYFRVGALDFCGMRGCVVIKKCEKMKAVFEESMLVFRR